MRGHYLECMGRGKALLNLPKELVEKGGIEKNKGEEGAPDTKKVKHDDVLKCYGCKHVYRFVFRHEKLRFCKVRPYFFLIFNF